MKSQQMKTIGRLSIILACSIALTSCETINRLFRDTTPTPISDSFVITDELFNCGPRPSDWPSREELLNSGTAGVVDLANEYWFWGMRCEDQLRLVQLYVNCNKGDKDACKAIEAIKEENDAE